MEEEEAALSHPQLDVKRPVCTEHSIRFYGSEVMGYTQSWPQELKPGSRKTRLYNERIINHTDAPPELQATGSEGSEKAALVRVGVIKCLKG